MSRFEIGVTSDAREVREAQKLRFQVFNRELGKGLASSYEGGVDADPYDAFCDHILVRDSACGSVVGTYRLLLGSRADQRLGFYSESEFDLRNIRKQTGELLELGRSCIQKDYRQSVVMDMMWQTIAAYIRTHRVRYVFGCASLPTVDPGEVGPFFALLKRDRYSPEHLRVEPLATHAFPLLDAGINIPDARAVYSRLPRLIQGYLKVGAVVCGPPALDREFGVTDFFLLLNVRDLGHETQRHFGFFS